MNGLVKINKKEKADFSSMLQCCTLRWSRYKRDQSTADWLSTSESAGMRMLI